MAGALDGNWLNLGGKVCVVTGAARGLGGSIATALAAQGCRLALFDVDLEALEQRASDWRSTGVDVIAQRCDVSDAESVEAGAAETERAFGKIDILVNNAGILRPGSLADLALADWNALLQINLTGYFLCAQRFGRSMRSAGGGAIVNVSSISGVFPQPYSGAYSVSKAGLQMLSKGLATEWGPFGVRSNVVSPAMMITPLTEAFYQDPAILARRSAAVPLQRIGTTEDLTNAVLFLASDRAAYLSGQEIVVDGGWSSNLLATVPRPGFDKPE